MLERDDLPEHSIHKLRHRERASSKINSTKSRFCRNERVTPSRCDDAANRALEHSRRQVGWALVSIDTCRWSREGRRTTATRTMPIRGGLEEKNTYGYHVSCSTICGRASRCLGPNPLRSLRMSHERQRSGRNSRAFRADTQPPARTNTSRRTEVSRAPTGNALSSVDVLNL
jgi:hypothetical protein